VSLPRGGADDVARILDVLLENAALHGCPESIAVGVGSLPQGVEVVVTDGGPGVPTALRARVFDWGVRRPESPGQGIGLHTAAGLARRLGGELRIDPGPRARFVLHLPDRRPTERPRVDTLTTV
jgi:signal transduction histidine kinase